MEKYIGDSPNFFNEIMRSKQMLDEWRRRTYCQFVRTKGVYEIAQTTWELNL